MLTAPPPPPNFDPFWQKINRKILIDFNCLRNLIRLKKRGRDSRNYFLFTIERQGLIQYPPPHTHTQKKKNKFVTPHQTFQQKNQIDYKESQGYQHLNVPNYIQWKNNNPNY